ncbi:MAG: hypothetical protein DCF25_15120 [Leptolyngbya foveolarum]|uniref:Uncharacterized protein n=1 Tax=Leptolyngbya foveolarum TaxID=47253 RepID=A0A2W4U2I8_9CYAN|nr:MAG: hypothetical protein DCF25_15120 [Leptolyngbya foveolarum]
MFALAISTIFGTPILVLAVGFLGVSQKRAEDGRAHLVSPSSAAALPTAKETVEQPTQKAAQPAF